MDYYYLHQIPTDKGCGSQAGLTLLWSFLLGLPHSATSAGD